VKFKENESDLYIALEAIKDDTPQSSVNHRIRSSTTYGNINIYKVNIKTKVIDWKTKVNKKNVKVYMSRKNSNVFSGTGSDYRESPGFISYSWIVKNNEILLLLNSNNKRTNNTFITKQKNALLSEKTPTSSLYALNINTATGKFCYKQFKEITDIIFNVNYGITEDNSLYIVGEDKEKKAYKILKF